MGRGALSTQAGYVAALALAAGIGAMLLPSAPAQAASTVCRDDTTGTANGATATGADATACGDGASANGDYSAAYGIDSVADEENSTALGSYAEAYGVYSTAVGTDAYA